MSHEIEAIAYVGEKPWHGLGNELTQGQPLEVWQQEAGLNWTVSKRPVQFSPRLNVDGEVELCSFKDKFVLARDTDNRPFSVVSNRYKPVQPGEILEFFRDLIRDFGMTIETAGSLRDGQRVWALAKTGDSHNVMGVDKVDSYLMLATSYDLTFSTLAQFTSVRVVCNNTLQQSFKEHTGRVTIPHFKDFDMNAVKQQLGVGREQWSSFTAMMDTLARIKLDESKAVQLAQKIFNVEPTIVSPENALNIKHASNVINLFDGRALGADIAGATGWGLVNSVTEYLDKYKRARSNSNRIDSSWFGDSFHIKQKAVEETLLLAA